MPTESIIADQRRTVLGPSTTNHLTNLRLVALVSSSALFAGLSQPECGEIGRYARERTFARGETLFAQGQPVRELILLRSGSVKHAIAAPNDGEALLRISGPGDVVNVPEPSASNMHGYSAYAMERSSTLVWDYRRTEIWFAQYSQIRMNLTQILFHRLQELEDRYREIATEKAARRLALVLVRLVKQIGQPCGGGIRVTLTREDLAQMTGSTLFTMSRIISAWSRLGFVMPRREAVVVTNLQRLRAVAQLEA